jgi:hypothetical protein
MMTTPLPTGWESDILSALGDPVGEPNISNLDTWQAAEGGSTDNPDSYNPMNTTLDEPGAVSTNSVGVKAYPDWATGLEATVSTIEQANMAPIAAALRANAPTPQFEAAVNASPWGTHFSGAPSSSTGAAASLTAFPGGSLDPLNWPSDIGQAIGAFSSSLYGIVVKGAVVLAGAGLIVAGGLLLARRTGAGQAAALAAPEALAL